MALQRVGEAAVAAFLQSVLRNLDAILAREDTTPFVNDFNPELKYLEEKLFSFKALLFDGETRRLIETDVDKWMDDLKDLVYDVDDILDGIPVQVSDVDSSHAFSSLNPIKDRLCKVLVRADRLRKMAEYLHLRRGIGSVPGGQSQPIRYRSETGPAIDESEIHGREEDKRKIVEMLLETNGSTRKNYGVICIVGMGGLGKTTLAQLLYRDQEVARLFDVKSWACISDVFDVARATKELIENSGQADGAYEPKTLGALQRSLENMVAGKRILFVLDDVWTTTEWDKMKAPLNSCANGSKILVTTQSDQVALDMSNNRSSYRLGELGHDQCWAIFKDKAFGEIDIDDVDQELQKLGEKIVSKCEGVPLAVKVIGSMLRGAEVERWKAVLENSIWNAAYEKREIHPAMRLYQYLPACLKRCFEYFGVFPSDHKFDQVQLVRMWIAEGLVEEEEGRIIEDVGHEYYNDLKGRSLIQENDMMHDIIHHLSCVLSKKFSYQANSCKPLASMRHAYYVFGKVVRYGLFARAHSLRTLIVDEDTACKLKDEIWSCKMLRVLHLADHRFNSALSEVPSSIGDMKHLRYLRLPQSKIFNLPDSICMLSNLQVLDLGGCLLENLPNNIGCLSNLRCLILYSSELSSLPDSICMLSNLQILDLGKCPLENLPKNLNDLSNLRCLILHSSKLSSLPDSVCSLCKLQVLDLEDCENLRQLPKDMGNLQSLRILNLKSIPAMLPKSIVNVTGLQELEVVGHHRLPPYFGRLSKLQGLPPYVIYKDKRRGRGIDQLRDMNRLKGYLVICNMENIEGEKEASMADLKSKKHIRELKFEWWNPSNYDAEMEVKIIEALQPHNALQSLTFFRYSGNRLPVWIMSSLGNLTRLVMQSLKMVNRMVGMEFASLVELWIEDCPMLSEILMATPKLRKLHVSCCGELRAVVLLPSLVSNMSDLHLIIAQLEGLECPCHVFDHFIEQLEAANSWCTKLKKITVMEGGVGVASLPRGWPSILKSLETLEIRDIDQANFQLLPNGDGSANFPPSLQELKLVNWHRMVCLPSDLCNLTSLGSLEIYNFPGLVSFEIQELPPDLQYFSIWGCENLTKLPDGFANFTSLNHVSVHACPNLVIFQEMIPRRADFSTDRFPRFSSHSSEEYLSSLPLQRQVERQGGAHHLDATAGPSGSSHFVPADLARREETLIGRDADPSIMAIQLVGEAAVAAFLQSILRGLAAILARGNTTPFVDDFNPELKKLEEKLFSFLDLLFDGETRRLFEKDVDKWMDDLKDLVYDVDDILDDINCGSTQPGNVQVSADLSHVQVSTIKSRLRKVSVRTDLLREEAKHDLNLRSIGSVPWGLSQPVRHRPETSPSVGKSEIHGREEDIKKIVGMLLEVNVSTRKKYDVICIVGMGGLGKTTLAHLVFDDQEVERHFDVKSWACISDDFDVTRVTKELLTFSGQADGTYELRSLAALQKRLEKIVKNKKILLVLDDVWTAMEWDEMKAPLNSCANGSKVLVTTRIDKVALVMGNNRSPYHLGILDHEQCWAVFKDKAFGEIDVDDVDQELKKLGQEIVRKCGGVPLAVKVIGSMLQGAEVERWKAVLENSLWNASYEDDEILPAMRLSYHYLPACLKRCFEYFAVFPSDYEFDQDQLVRMWIAEGLVEEVEGRIAEDIGNEYYNDLKGRSLIQEDDIMHDIIHHLSCMVSKKFCYRPNSCEPHASMRHASFVRCFGKVVNYGLFARAHSLRTLILDRGIAYKLLEDRIWSCKMLRVLNLSDNDYSSGLSKVPGSIGDMKHLRYLRLQHLNISCLPESICKLSNLQVLDLGECPLENLPNNLNYLSNLQCLILRSSKLSSLPESVCSLCKLQVLDLSNCRNLQILPEKIGNLQSIRILKLWGTPARLPESIVNVMGLQELKVDLNKKLPPCIG